MLLAVTLVFTSVDITVFAEEQETENVAVTEVQETEESEEEKEGVQGEQASSANETEVNTKKNTEENIENDSDKSKENQTDPESLIFSECETEIHIGTQEGSTLEDIESKIEETESISEDDTEIQSETEAEKEWTELEKMLEAEGNIDSGVIDEDYGHIIWVIDVDGKLMVQGTGDYSNTLGYRVSPWYSKCEDITSAIINVKGMTNTCYMFEGCYNLTSLDVSNFDTGNVTDMDGMFGGCSSLTSLDVSNFDTKNVTDMGGMFGGCSSLTSLDISSFNTSKVTDMDGMFSDCSSLTSLDVSNFDTGNVIDMDGMFWGCSSLTSLDVSNFDTKNVTDMGGMFGGCSSLASLDISSFDTSKVTDMDGMFSDCSSLTSLDVSNFDTGNVTDMDGMFGGCSSLTSLDVSNFDTGNVSNMFRMFHNCRNLTSLDVSNFDTGNVTDMGWMFDGCNSLTSLDISSFDTSKVTDMNNMFAGCYNMISLDVSHLDTGHVTDMHDMFAVCDKLESLDVSHFDTSKVTDMQGMFASGYNLKNLNLRSFNTGKVTDMHDMFIGCRNLTSLDLSSFDTEKVTDMHNMFRGCSSLISLNISSFNTGKVTDMSYIFSECRSLISMDVSSFDTSNVINMEAMFCLCINLKSMDVSSFDTSNVIDMVGMFSFCSSLTRLDLSNFDTRNVINMYGLFDNSPFNVIYTPKNVTQSVDLPIINSADKWYRSDGTIATELPQNLSHSVALGRNKIPTEKEIEEEIIEKVVIDEGVSISKSKSMVKVIDAKTGNPLSGAKVWTKGVIAANENGIVELDETGLTTIRVEMEGYHTKSAKKNLEKGKAVVITLCPDTGKIELLSASLNLTGEDKDVLNNTVSIIHRDFDEEFVEGGEYDATFTLRVESSGSPTMYQLIQKSKVIQENATGTFELKGKCINNKDGTVTCYTDKLSAGYKVSVRVFDGNKKSIKHNIGIRVSEGSSTALKFKDIDTDWKLEPKKNQLGLTVVVPKSVPLIGDSEFDLGFKDKLPVTVKYDMEDNKVKIAVNFTPGTGDLINTDSMRKAKEEYENLAKKAIKASNAAKAFGGTPNSFGGGMFSVKGSIVGYGEGYWDDLGDTLCVNVGLIIKVQGEAKYTQYFFLSFIPFYVTFGGGLSLTTSGEIRLAFDGKNLFCESGGDLEMEPSAYMNIEGGVGADGILSIGAYGKIKLSWLHRFLNNYDRISLNGNVKIKAKAFLWSKVLAEMDGTYVIRDSNKKQKYSTEMLKQANIDYQDLSGAELISMDYLSKRAKQLGEYGISTFSNTKEGILDSIRILDYAFENASPRLLEVGNKLYLFYLDGVKGRNAQNQTALFCSVSSDNGNTWSEEIRVDNNANETADYNFDVATDGTNIYVAWSDAGFVYGDEILSMDSSEAIAKVGKETNLMLAVINSNTGKIDIHTLMTDDADLQPQVMVGDDGTVYVAWITNDVSADGGLISSENQMGICYASSAENYEIHSIILQKGYYPMTLDMGVMGSNPYIATDLDIDADLNTQEDREIYILDLKSNKNLSVLTSNNVTNSVPLFGSIAGKHYLFWYQDGNIAYTEDGHNISYVFDSENLPPIGQEFALLEGGGNKAALVWTATSVTEDVGADVYCTDFDGSDWTVAYRLGELDSEYISSLSGRLDNLGYQMVYLSSIYEGEELYSHINMLQPHTRIETDIVWTAQGEETAGEAYPVDLVITNTGNTTINSLDITSRDGSIQDKITGLSIAPGTSHTLTWNGLSIPKQLTEIYHCILTIKAVGETASESNTFDIALGVPDFSVDAYLDYSSGDHFASVTVTNSGIITSDAVLTVYADEGHTKELYQMELSQIPQGESRVTIFDLTAMDKTAQTFYFDVLDKNGGELYTENNETLLYVGKGIYLEYEDEKEKPSHISVTKSQTVYEYGDILYTDDLTVMLHYNDGTSKKITDYNTDVDTVDMYTLGTKVLTVAYQNMETTINIKVEPRMLDERTSVVLPYASCKYDGTAKEPLPVSVSANSMILDQDIDYTVSWSNNVDVGEAIIYIVGKNNYQGTLTCSFVILEENLSEEPSTEQPSEEPTTEPLTEEPSEEPTTEPSTEEPTTKPKPPAEEPTDTENQGDGLWVSGVSKSGYPYTGEAVKPVIKVFNKTTLLTEKSDYTISYKNNTKAGKATIIVTGKGNYSGKETVTFDILPMDIGSKEVHAMDFYVKIGKKAQKPVPELYYMGIKLKNNKDFKISYANSSNVYAQTGEYSVTITGKGNYIGTRTLQLMAVEKIVKPKPVSIAKASLNGFNMTFIYTGKACTQECILVVKNSEGEKILTKGMDYTIQYANNIKAGTATVTYYGKNGYTGKLKKTYKILPYNIQDDYNSQINYENNFNYVYAKGGSKPKPVVTFDGKALKEGVDYTLSYKNNKAVLGNQASCVVVNGKGCFKGKIPINFTITSQDLSKMTLVSGDKVYKNKANIYSIKPKLMDLDGKQLSAGKDFDPKSITYVYENDVVLENGISKKAGSSVEKTDIIPVDTQIRITLNCGSGGNYVGTFTGIYRIVKADIKSAKVTIPKQIYTGNEITLDKSQITVKLSGVTLKPEDYEIIQYANNVKKGKASVTIKGKDNYGGVKTVKFTIGAKGFLWWWRK